MLDNMFLGAEKFNQPLNNWNVSLVKGMNRMFNNAKAFNQDISNWNTGFCTSCSDFSTDANPAWSDDKKPVFTRCNPGY